jgi:hypothetical protein
VAYYCDCLLQDPFGDRRWIDQKVLPRGAGHGLGAALVRANFAFYRGAPSWPATRHMLSYSRGRGRHSANEIKQWATSSKWKGEGTLVYTGAGAVAMGAP